VALGGTLAVPAIAASNTASGTATVGQDATIAEAKAAAAAAAKTACAKRKSATKARIVVKSGDTSASYSFKCSEVAKSASSGTTPTTTSSGSTPGLVGTANPTVPEGVKGQLDVVANGPLDENSGSVPVAVRNNTGRAVTAVEVQGSARDSSGALVGSGSSQGLEPAAIAPGEIGIGYVFFSGKAPNASQFTFTTTSKPSKGPGRDYFAGVSVAEHNKTEENNGFLTGHIVGTVVNPLQVTVTGPISVLAMCFDANGQPTKTVSGFAEGDELAIGASTTFSADYYESPCPAYLVGASGYNQGAI